MCVAAPGRIVSIGKRSDASIPATVRIGEHTQAVDLVMLPQAEVGDYVVTHSGFGIRVVNSEDALLVLRDLGFTTAADLLRPPLS